MCRTLVAMSLAVTATLVGVAWHEVESSRAAQRPQLLSIAFAGAGELQDLLQAQGATALPDKLTWQMEEQLRQRLADLGGPEVLQTLGATVEVIRHVPDQPEAADRYTRTALLSIPDVRPIEASLQNSNQGALEAMMLQKTGSNGIVASRFPQAEQAGLPQAEWIVAAAPVTHADRMTGAVVVRQPLFQFEHLMLAKHLVTIVAVAAGMGILPGLLLGIGTGRRIGKRARRLTNGLLALRQGAPARRCPS